MSSDVPAWLEARQLEAPLPDWLSVTPRLEEPARVPVGKLSKEKRELLFAQYEMVMPRILDMLSAGYTLKKAFRELPIEIDHGAFMGWIRRDPKRTEMYRTAKEIRTEAWADEIIRHAEGKDENGEESMVDTARSKLIVDTYWKLMGADNRKQYGDTKTIEMNTSISISAALAQAQGRVIEAQVIDEDDVIDAPSVRQISAPEDDDD